MRDLGIQAVRPVAFGERRHFAEQHSPTDRKFRLLGCHFSLTGLIVGMNKQDREHMEKALRGEATDSWR
jgi:hypothetical protein